MYGPTLKNFLEETSEPTMSEEIVRKITDKSLTEVENAGRKLNNESEF